jgi:hypothetical protein
MAIRSLNGYSLTQWLFARSMPPCNGTILARYLLAQQAMLNGYSLTQQPPCNNMILARSMAIRSLNSHHCK